MVTDITTALPKKEQNTAAGKTNDNTNDKKCLHKFGARACGEKGDQESHGYREKESSPFLVEIFHGSRFV